jgi:hypothetical protein
MLGRPRRRFSPSWPWTECARDKSRVRLDLVDYGFSVTICLAAITRDRRHIISVSDRRLSFGYDAPAADILLKDHTLCTGWGALFCANDTSYALPILGHARGLLSNDQPRTLANVRQAMCESYAIALEDYVTKAILRKFGFKSLMEFRTTAISQLGRKLSWSLSRKIDRATIGDLEFLVYGFDAEHGSAHLFHVQHPGFATSVDQVGYFAIGSGCKMAMNSLQMRPIQSLSDQALIYRLVEAKFAAETADGVGPNTTVFTLERGSDSAGFILPATIEKYRQHWEKWRAEPPPEEILKLIAVYDMPQKNEK